MKIIAETCLRLGKAVASSGALEQTIKPSVTRMSFGKTRPLCHMSPNLSSTTCNTTAMYSCTRRMSTMETLSSGMYDDAQDDEIANGRPTATLTAVPRDNKVEVLDEYDYHMNTMKDAFEILQQRSTIMHSSLEDPVPLQDTRLMSTSGEMFDPLATDISHYREHGGPDDFSAGLGGES